MAERDDPYRLLRAVDENRLDDVRRIANENAKLMNVPTGSGTFPIELAQQKGYPYVAAALLRAGAPGDIDAGDLLLDYIYCFSQDWTCATWLGGIEFILWSLARNEFAFADTPFLFDNFDDESRADLSYLADRCGGWWTWEDSGPTFVTSDRWHEMYSMRGVTEIMAALGSDWQDRKDHDR